MINSKDINNISRIYFSAICLLVAFNNIVFQNYSREYDCVVGFIVLIISIYLVYFYRNNMFCLFMYFSIMYFNYSIIITRYFFKKEEYLYSLINDQNIYSIGINILMIFMSILLMFAKISENKSGISKNISLIKYENKSTVLCIVFIFIIFIIFLLQMVTEGAGRTSQLYEYSLVFFLIAYYYSGKDKIIIGILNLLMLIYCINTFIDGDRVSVLQLIIAYVLIVKIDKLSFKKIIVTLVIGIVTFTALGLYGDGRSITDTIDVLKDRLFALDTSVFAYYTSLTFVKVKDLTSISQQLQLFYNFILSLIFGGSIPNSSLTEYTRGFYLHYNGGLLPTYFYFYLGWIGVVISGIIVAYYTKIITNLKDTSSDYRKILSIYIVSTVPRWYLYSPVPLIRGVALLSIVFIGSNLIIGMHKLK